MPTLMELAEAANGEPPAQDPYAQMTTMNTTFGANSVAHNEGTVNYLSNSGISSAMGQRPSEQAVGAVADRLISAAQAAMLNEAHSGSLMALFGHYA